MAKRDAITQARLKELFHYDPLTGLFRRLISVGSRGKAGDFAGSISVYGYLRIQVDGVMYFSHRLAWRYMTGEFPSDKIDHINHVRDDNRWVNLTQATDTTNNKNTILQKNNTSGSCRRLL